MTMNFKGPEDLIYVVGVNRNDINCSEYLHQICGVTHSPAPYFDLEEEHKLQQAILRVIGEKLIRSAHDIAEGGLFITLLESAMAGGFGFNIVTDSNIRKDAFLFGEAQSRVVVSVNADLHAVFEAELGDVPFAKIGKVTMNQEIVIDNEGWGYISDWKNTYDTAIEKLLSN
jgi:phosphoribosylformylglycinamidine synthase